MEPIPVEAALSGGSGRASVESPAVVEVKDGKAEATIIWSSSNYDYVRVDEENFFRSIRREIPPL